MRGALGRTAAMAVALGFALAARADPLANAPYDGTGSVFVPAAADPSNPGLYAKFRADEAKQWLTVVKAAGDGKRSDTLLDYAALLEQGDSAHAPDPAAALDVYEKAADLGNKVAIRRMVIAYLLGEGRTVDWAKGFAYSHKLADKDGVVQFSAGYDYENGVSGPRDQGLAIAGYIEAARAGNADGMDAVGRIALAQGKPDVARGWFRQGVFSGSADAMDHLAVMAEAGRGGSMDKAEAYWLYVNAARRGNDHAKAWVAALPASATPLPRSSLRAGQKEMTVTRTYGAPDQVRTESLNATALGKLLQNYYPTVAGASRMSGMATIHCYINASHQIDVCIIEREFPAGYDFGAALHALYDGQLSVSETDAVGRPTANSVFALSLSWQIS